MKTLIKTPKSSLNLYDIDTIFDDADQDKDDNSSENKQIIAKCVEEIKDKYFKILSILTE